MLYLKKFDSVSDYDTYYNDYIKTDIAVPNVSYIIETDNVKYNKKDGSFMAPVGASIYANNEKFYTAEEWVETNRPSTDVIGIYVNGGDTSFLIHPTAEKKSLAWGIKGKLIGNDNNGVIMTEKIASSVNYDPGYAAVYCMNTTFSNGKTGYLMTIQEFMLAYTYIDSINNCLTVADGTIFDLNGKNYWTCYEQSADIAKYWAYLLKGFGTNPKFYSTPYVRPVTTL